ncbi:MAG: nucleotide exchange factor GrpE [Nanoarchaeota archaeon]
MNTKQEMNMGDKEETKEVINEYETQLKIDVQEKDKIISDYESTMKRLQADFDNYVKRTQKEKEDFAKIVVARILVRFVDIADDLDRALNILEKTQDNELKTGIKMVHARFHKILQDEGIKSFSSKGKKIDPYFHEVIEMVPSGEEEGLIVEEIQKGYVMKDHILRTAKVKVSKRTEKQ